MVDGGTDATGIRTWTAGSAGRVLTVATGSDDKYSRGVVGLRTGSEAFPGAAVLGVEAAWRTGVGMVRYVGPRRAADLVLARRPETVTADGRVQAWVIGSGTDAAARSADETAALRSILSGPVPVVVDAGALDLAVGASASVLVTPHASEYARLRGMLGLDAPEPPADLDEREESVRQTAATLGGTVLLKGATTIVATPSGWTSRVSSGTPWLATAGTGDVLGGVLGALVATAHAADAEALGALAATGAWLHGRAGSFAAGRYPGRGGPIVALDVADSLPRAIAEALATVG
ncbi:MAG: NAD(P)H-hydrate dehydratase [Microbacterium sp.]|uniref:ADP-dependent NAD(P)H-hydrate dehydratase n=1 Tax=Microbacterium sp. TaxID=51671 RepID=UPI001AC038E2|nr:ADP/ATP-dependent (S)-NAD(P)H-hydrate dehydratase [Microbacterium sp.]MBN9154282.1 NAD(P)H-hydrate dehydratase [Microbacterium sp.]